MWAFLKKKNKKLPRLSIVLIAYDMQREVPRTLFSLGRSYQQQTDNLDYEIIVIDNGSPTPLTLTDMGCIGVPVRHYVLGNASVSPASAINHAVSLSESDYVCIMIDGARMVSPGVIRGIFNSVLLAEEPVIAIPGLHLGPAHQKQSVKAGYSKNVEDKLLESIDWKADGYRLFQIASWGGSCQFGWFGPMAESNCITVRREFYSALQGYDEAFCLPGGGLVNLDFYKRAVEAEGTTLIQLLGEGCFHQLHGGVTTGSQEGLTFKDLEQEYIQLRERQFEKPLKPAILYGQISPEVWPALMKLSEAVTHSTDFQSVEHYCQPYMEVSPS